MDSYAGSWCFFDEYMPSADIFTIIDKFKILKKAYYPFLKKIFVRGTILNWAQPWFGEQEL